MQIPELPPLPRRLSQKEREVLWLTAWGYSLEEIAARFKVIDKTVSTYKTRASAKLGLSTRRSIVRYAWGQGWFGVDPEVVAHLPSAES